MAAVKSKKPGWIPNEIEDGYGPMKGVDELAEYLREGLWFSIAKGTATEECESLFLAALRRRVAV